MDNIIYRCLGRIEKAMWKWQYKNKCNKNEDTSSKYDKTEIVQITVLMEL